mmetsp:Transcript_95081/g.306266  ORF Transcript_95081/g.306266 Transcript_95081/m.306266 type:complete len:609 (-) Transcript_95081:48-1874(-)
MSCTYAALILHDSGASITPEAETLGIAAGGVEDVLDAIAAGLFDVETPSPSLAALWRRAAAAAPTPGVAGTTRGAVQRSSGRVLALAGALLCGPLRISAASKGPRLSDASAVRLRGRSIEELHEEAARRSVVAAAVGTRVEDVHADDGEGGEGELLQQEARRALLSAAPWAGSAEDRSAANDCIRKWIEATGAKVHVADGFESVSDDFERKVLGAALMDLLPAVATSLRSIIAEAKGGLLGAGPSCSRRALATVLSFHWLLERVHFTSLRDRFGLCLPPILQALDKGGADASVRLAGLASLHLLLDRAMAAEVQRFVPPLQHCFATLYPLFLQDDLLAQITVAPFCAGCSLFMLKAYTSGSIWRQEVLDKFLLFGSVHCRSHSLAFRLFLELGLLPLLEREALVLAPRLKLVMELLLQAAESPDARVVLLAWRSLVLLLCGSLRPRAGRYMADLLLRLALGYLTFVASLPPPGLDLDAKGDAHGDSDGAAGCPDAFVSPVVAAMTAAEWRHAVRLRPALRQALASGVGLLAVREIGDVAITSKDRLEEMLMDLDTLLSPAVGSSQRADTKPTQGARAHQLAPALGAFAKFARGAATAAAVQAAGAWPE